jgi:hypothetical protein
MPRGINGMASPFNGAAMPGIRQWKNQHTNRVAALIFTRPREKSLVYASAADGNS